MLGVYQWSGIAPTSCAICFFKKWIFVVCVHCVKGLQWCKWREPLHFKYWIRLSVYFSSFLKNVCFNQNPRNILCCCLLWFRLSSFVTFFFVYCNRRYISSKSIFSPTSKLTSCSRDADGFTMIICWSKDGIIGVMWEWNVI